jgi:hypothetical protein
MSENYVVTFELNTCIHHPNEFENWLTENKITFDRVWGWELRASIMYVLEVTPELEFLTRCKYPDNTIIFIP